MNLTIEQMRKIVDGAPEWAVFWITRNEYHISMLSFPNMTGQQSYLISDLRAAIADHDRTDHVDFKVGDKVVFEAHFCDEHKGLGYGEITYCTMDKRVFEIDNYYLVSIDEIRHATPEEIAAGHRIDANTDYVTDIRNHISPMTIVQGDL
ncbi:hypothetical protein HXZ60_02085 [Acinetobacter towneri]|uniref:hypothetical protein n=1 Tax=Acinetobacter towneri TaxID=202956 RepID=UPI0025756352|nr:hypothetical protein [Acinetobacter towneri]MDM1282389.1 hypothetical protein [Acinetobacter towneri]